MPGRRDIGYLIWSHPLIFGSILWSTQTEATFEINSNVPEGTDRNRVTFFSVIGHLIWGLWSIVNATVSQIPFGYWEYAEERLTAYMETKAALTSVTDSVGVKRKTEDID